MTLYSLSGKSYELPETSKEFLDSYLKRLRTYTREHNISETYLDDIIERINDKLTQLEIWDAPIKNSDIIKIVNDIGEPEDIFPLGTESNKKQNPIKEVFQRPLKRDTENGILFGVCAGIAKYFDLDPLWVRLIFIALIFFWGAGAVLYIILVFLMPAEDTWEKILKKNSKDSSFIEQARTITNSGNQRVSITSIFLAIGKFNVLVFRLLLKIILLAICCLFIGFFIAWVVVSGIVLSGTFEIGNQQFFSNIPDALGFSLPLLTVLSLILSIALFGHVIGRDLFGKRGWLIVFLSSAIGFIFLATGCIELIKDYMWTESKTTESIYSYTGKSINIMNDLDGFGNKSQLMGIWEELYIEKVKWLQSIIIRSTTRLQTKDQSTAQYIIDNMNFPVYSLSGNTLSIKRSEWLNFKKMVPFAFPERNIQVMIPENIEVVGDYARQYNDDSMPEIPNIPEAPEPHEAPELPQK